MTDLIISSTIARLSVLIGIFTIVAILLYLAMTALSRRIAIRAELAELSGPVGAETRPAEASVKFQDRENAWARLADLVERTGLNLADTKSDRLREKLIAAGFASPSAPRVFTLLRLVLVIALPLVYVGLAFLRPEPPGFLTLYVVGSILALLGLYLPNLFVRARADRRKEAIINGFPDCLDLMLVCVEAGLGIEAAMDRVGREMVQAHPLVSQLLSIAVLQLRAGSSREEAYRRLADLAGVDEIRSFATLLIQSDKLGTSISTTLRVYAAEMREKRRMRAEEKAHRLPVLISIPLVVFMLPTMIGVLMLPAAVRVVRDVVPMMTGGA
ncbi:MAG TPA: type II secretion system F family protein [Croceibacterium sp.]|nr:type II secretion system F family protein [Croceibacterium sp.]